MSLAPDGSGDVIISARSLDAVLRIRRNPGGVDDGRILWKLGGTTPQSNATVHYTMTGDPLGSFLREHDAALLANGHVMLFDNQSPPPPAGRPQASPRALEIALDPATETARIVRSVPWPAAPVSSFGVGAARLQADGSVLVTWGGQSSPAFTEVDATGATVLTGTLTDELVLLPGREGAQGELRRGPAARHGRPVAAPSPGPAAEEPAPRSVVTPPPTDSLAVARCPARGSHGGR